MRRRSPIDFMLYLRAVGLYARNPSLILGPLVTSLAGAILLVLVPPTVGNAGSLTGGLMQLFVMLLDSFGLAVSLIVAEAAWRYGRAPFDDAWSEARRKAPDILLAAVGFTFLLQVAGLVGGFLSGLGALILTIVAAFFFIYTIPAAAIGGTPGFGALQASIERVQRSYPSTLLLAVVIVLLFWVYLTLVGIIGPYLALLGGFAASNACFEIVKAVIASIGLGYIALVMAKSFDDASYLRY